MVKLHWGAVLVIALAWTAEPNSGAQAAPGRLPVIRDCRDCPQMVIVPAGAFAMGSSEDETQAAGAPPEMARSERPVRQVTVARAFAMARTPVTRVQFSRFVRRSGHRASGCWFNDGGTPRENPALSWRNPGFRQTDRDPVVCVSPDDAKAYTAWLSRVSGKAYRLPSEAEWEYAARAGATGPRPWPGADESLCRHANLADRSANPAELIVPPALGGDAPLIADCSDGFAHTSPVGSFPPNAFGLFDMLGNVWQITADCWNPNYENRGEGTAPVTTGDCKRRVYKGGAWNNPPPVLRPAARNQRLTSLRGYSSGFRVVRDLGNDR